MSATSEELVGAARRVTLELPTGQRIAALQAGAAGAAAVLLVPGYTGSKEDFGPILDPLAAAGCFVTAIDLPGQYESPGLPCAADYTPDRLGTIVRDLARLLAAPVRLLGHSFGGLVARAAAIAEPALFSSLVLMSSGPARLGGARGATIDQLEPLLATAGLAGIYAAMQAAAAAAPGFVPPPPDVAAFLERRFLRNSPTMLQGMGDALRREPDRVVELAATPLPILVLHGVADDAWPPPEQRDMARRLGAHYEIIDGAAHSPAVENPASTISSLLAFWARC